MHRVFHALADPNRLRIMDIVKEKPGITVNELAAHFEFTRYAVMKHLKVLDTVDLVVTEREGKFKKLFINVIPIQMIYDRWTTKYSALWANQLTSLKYSLEKEKHMKDLSHVFVVYIKSSKEELWKALTDPELTQKYFFGTKVESDWKKGSKILYMATAENGESGPAIDGKILEIEKYKRLAYSFSGMQHPGDKASRAEFDIEESDFGLKVTVRHDGFEKETETYHSVAQGWPVVLSGLKTYLETGEPMMA